MNNRLYLFIILLITGLSNCFSQDYDLNLSVSSYSRQNGGSIVIDIQARSLVSPNLPIGGNGASHGIVDLPLSFNPLAVSYQSVVVQPPYDGFSNTTPTTISGQVTFVATQGLTTDIPNTWTTIFSATFLVLDNTQNLDFVFGAPDITLQPNTTYAVDFTFDQITHDGTSWTGGNGPSGAPNTTDAAKEMILTSVTPNDTVFISADAEVEYFTSDGNAILKVEPGIDLGSFVQSTTPYTGVNASTFVVGANSSGYGQFIGGPVTGTFKQYVGTYTNWRNISFPVTSPTVNLGGAGINLNGGTSAICVPTGSGDWGNFINTTNVYTFTAGSNGCTPTPANVEHEWTGVTGSIAGASEGYSIYLGTPFFATNGKISAAGSSLTSSTYNYTHFAPHDIVLTGSSTGSQSGNGNESDYNGWRLVGNPFPSCLDVASFVSDNSLSGHSIRVWDNNTNDYIDVINSSIAPFQSFWIKFGTAPSSQTLDFNSTQRTFVSNPWLKTSSVDQVKLIAERSTGETSVINLEFNPLATDGYDKLYDGFDLRSSDQNAPNLAFTFDYVHPVSGNSVSSPMDFNSVPLPSTTKTFDLNFESKNSGSFDFKIDNSLLPPGLRVYIEDLKTNPGNLHNITNSAYSFNYNPSDDLHRFKLHLGWSGIGFEEQSVQGMDPVLWFSKDEMNIDFNYFGTSANVDINVYDLYGNRITGYENIYTNEIASLPFGYINGIYIVIIETKNSDKTYRLKSVKQ